MNKELQNKATKLAGELEDRFGSDTLLKIGMSAINRLLVDKGFITERECCEYFVNEAEYFIKETKL